MDVKGDVAEILNTYLPNIHFISDNGNGVHPKTVFGIIKEISTRDLGTMRKQLNSVDGSYFYAQPYITTINIGIQGLDTSDAKDIAQDLLFMMNTPILKRLFREKGYSVRVDSGTLTPIPMVQDTTVFVRHLFTIWLSYDYIKFINQLPINAVDTTGNVVDEEGNNLINYNEIIEK